MNLGHSNPPPNVGRSSIEDGKSTGGFLDDIKNFFRPKRKNNTSQTTADYEVSNEVSNLFRSKKVATKTGK